MTNNLGEFTHVDLLFPSNYLKAADLQGADTDVTIIELEPRHELTMRGGVKESKPVLRFKEIEGKRLVLNKTNAQAIAKIHGGELRGWLGKRVTLYPTRVACGRDTVDAIRVREKAPAMTFDWLVSFYGREHVAAAWRACGHGLPAMGAGVGETLTQAQLEMLRGKVGI